MQRYVLVNEEGIGENVIVWDGNADAWSPPEGFKCVLEKSKAGQTARAKYEALQAEANEASRLSQGQ
jgi:hypothetical protein